MDLCKEQNLPEPDFKEEQGGISVRLYKDIYREESLLKMGLNERQIKAVLYSKENGNISNSEYMELTKVSRQTATRDLSGLVKSKIFKKRGITGKGTEYSI